MAIEQAPFVSIIIPVKNEGDNVRATITSLFHTKTNYPYEVIVVDDGSTDHSCRFIRQQEVTFPIKLITTEGIGASMARNVGADQAKGNFLIFATPT